MVLVHMVTFVWVPVGRRARRWAGAGLWAGDGGRLLDTLPAHHGAEPGRRPLGGLEAPCWAQPTDPAFHPQ